MQRLIKKKIEQHKNCLLFLEENISLIEQSASFFISTLKEKGKVLFFGNGGSAADAQHLAAEFVGRFKMERSGLPAIALSTDTSILTALANDFGFETVFARQIQALGEAGDLAVGISTSGESPNVIEGIKAARLRGLKTIGLLGRDGGKLKDLVYLAVVIPQEESSLIQEMHILIGHIICEIVENELFK